MYWFALLQLAIALLAVWCARLTRPDRNYWPMLRVIWSALATVYGGAALNTVLGGTGQPSTRTIFLAVMLAAVAYSLWFMRKRNRLARIIRLTIGGDIVLRSLDELEGATDLAESWAHHGAMTPAAAARLKAALAVWDERQAWKADLVRQTKAREQRERKGE